MKRKSKTIGSIFKSYKHTSKSNKAGYTALGAPKHLYKNRRNGPTDGRTDGRTDRRTDERTDPLKEVLRST